MIRLALVLLALTGPAMAKDGNIQAPRAPIQTPPMEDDADRYLDELFQQFQDGKLDMSQAKDLYEKRFGPDPLLKQGKR